MSPISATSSPFREVDLRTSSAEERARTFHVTATGSRATLPGPATGDVLKNRFVVHQCLTDGTTSRLFRARDRRRDVAGDTDPWVALKVVTASPGRELHALRALRREAAIAARLEHPNLPHILGIDHDGPHTFLCMAWLEGDSLAAILDSRGPRPMTRVQALHIVEGVCRALVHVHNQGITHADVKPGNILVTTEGNATLLDFGVALGPDAADLPEVHGYTPEYASPEVLAGATPTPADDLFSLACVAYRMLSGHRPFGTGNARDAAVQETRPPCPPNLSPAQWRALDKALAFTRAERQPDVAAFLAQLKGFREDGVGAAELTAREAFPALMSAAGSRPLRRQAWPAASVVASALLGATVATLVFRQQQQPVRPVSSGRVARTEAAAASAATPQPRAVGEAGLTGASARTAGLARAPAAMPEPAGRPAREPAALSATPHTNDLSAAVAAGSRVELAGPPQPEPGPAPVATADRRPDGGLPDTGPTAGEGAVAFSSLTVRHYVEPKYPRAAAVRRLPGWVDVAFSVDQAGRTQDVRVMGAEPTGVFEDAAVAAVRRWRFAAGTPGPPVGDISVSSRIRVRFDPK